jgi:aspartate 1-decarboxylase
MLSQNIPIVPITNGAAAVTLGKVVKASSGTCVVTTAATEAILGVITEDCAANGVAAVAPAGSGAIVLVEASASGIAIGDNLAPVASGQCNKTTTSTHKVFAVALEASTAAGQLIKAVLSPAYYTLP